MVVPSVSISTNRKRIHFTIFWNASSKSNKLQVSKKSYLYKICGEIENIEVLRKN